MEIKILVDMNLSPRWVSVLEQAGWQSIHWSSVGTPTAPDVEIMKWARDHEHVIFTHDLDFGTLLALTHRRGPSVIQVRTQNVLPDHLESLVCAALKQHEPDMLAGALVVVDEYRTRVRILPIRAV
ncbi:MAG TPA: DUF5615 family PIN-like protein [Chloroflexota bacterium]|jgi:predicted nuclease of predicted toxin-antitoxin system|nr:DUF5615 family PIN-like protein [Chloroflexota bacterium]